MGDAKSRIRLFPFNVGAAHQAKRGFAAGVCATIIMSLALLLGMAMGGSLLPEPVPMAVMEAALGVETPALLVLSCAVIGHLLYGGAWGALLAAVLPPITETRGVMLGLFLWLIEQLFVVPALGWGIFGSTITPSIAATSFVFVGTSLILHLIYGQTYGMLLAKEVL